MFKALWSFRVFILASIRRDFQSRYQNSLLGILWPILNPLATIVVYAVVFSHVMKAKLPGVEGEFSYSIYLCSGMIVWGVFSDITQGIQKCFVENGNLLKKLVFPRICLPLIVMGNALINFLIIFVLFCSFLLITNNFPGVVIIAILPIIAIVLLVTLGLGIFLGVLNVFFRDMSKIYGIFLQFLFWLTPIVYPSNIMPKNMQYLISLNPLTQLIEAFQTVFLLQHYPAWESLAYPTIISILFCALGYVTYSKLASDMVDGL
jgi:lipopolysaccharide transport system permease protein